MSAKQRYKNRDTALKLYYLLPPQHQCVNCGEYTHNAHYCPPSMGDKGIWICKKDIPEFLQPQSGDK